MFTILSVWLLYFPLQLMPLRFSSPFHDGSRFYNVLATKPFMFLLSKLTVSGEQYIWFLI